MDRLHNFLFASPESSGSANESLKYCCLLGGLIPALVFLLPRLILGQDLYVLVLDNLDCEFMYRVLISERCGLLDSSCRLDNVFNGLPRDFLVSGLNVVMFLFYLFEPFTAFAINEAVVHYAAFTGMALLLSTHLPLESRRPVVVLGASLAFSLLPFYSIHGLTIAGQPLVFYAFLNLRARRLVAPSFAILCLFPFYAALHLAGLFILGAAGLVFLFDAVRDKRPNALFLIGLAACAIIFAIVELNLIKLMVFGGVSASHRTEWNELSGKMNKTFGQSMLRFVENLFVGQYHAASLHIPIVSVLAALMIQRRFKNRDSDEVFKSAVRLFLVAAIISLAYALFSWRGLNPIKALVPFLKTFNLGRVHWLHPTVWCVLMALLIANLLRYRWGNRLAGGFIVFQLLFVVLFNHGAQQTLKYNYRLLLGLDIEHISRVMTFRRIFSEALYDDIEKHINRPISEYRVISVGAEPYIAQYNGFYTLDSYQNNYPLVYKHKFREVIAGELEKNPEHKSYFDNWGSRCYVFVASLHTRPFIKKDDNITIDRIDLNTKALKALGGDYVFSNVEIRQAAASGLGLIKTFERDDSPWRVHLYEVKPK